MSVRLRLSLLLFLAAALVAPASAAALVGRFTFPATHGYRATLTAYGFGANLRLTRVRGANPKRASWVYYIVHAKGGADRIDAGFGDLGRLHMRFAPNGTVTHSSPESGCHGPDRYTYRHGALVGSFRFAGEGAYTTIDAHRGAGTVASPAGPLHCAGSGEEGAGQGGGAPQAKTTALAANWRRGLRAEDFSATREGAGPASFEATVHETDEEVAIYRRVLAQAPAGSFLTDSALSFATVTPPPPFIGSGFLRREPGGQRTWSGPLAVAFPGEPGVALTGPPFRTLLTRSW